MSVFLICIIIICVFIYFLPSFIARKKRHANLIFLFNIFFGWTCLGWVASLIWALCETDIEDLKKLDALYKYVEERKKEEQQIVKK